MKTCTAVLALATLGLSWLGMMAVHEVGHVLHAAVSGGTVARVILGPFEMSRTDLVHNPHPAFVAVGGVVWGAILPVLLSLSVPTRWTSARHLARFFAGFCLIANGLYPLVGSLHDAGDPGDLRHLGVPMAALLLVGALEAVLGLWTWHRLGPGVGFGIHASRACRTAPILTALLAGVVALEWLAHSFG